MNLQFVPPSAAAGDLSQILKAAIVALNNRDHQKSIELFTRASAMDKTNIDVLLELGLAHGLRYDFPAAESFFEKAFRVADRKGQALALAGKRCVEFQNFEMAERYFKRAADRSDSPPIIFTEMAAIYQRQHRMEDAAIM